MYKFINKLFAFIAILIIIFAIFMTDGFIESNKINNSIDEFISRGIYVNTIDNISYYKVVKKYDYEDCDNILDEYSEKSVGTIGDMYITDRNPLKGFAVTEFISNKTWIGHCGIVYNEDGTLTLETVGNKSVEENKVKVRENIWLDIDAPRYLIMRVKGINDEQKDILKQEYEKIMDCRYNHSFIFGSKRHFYCSDMISYLYDKLDINLNDDYFLTTGGDLICAEQTYIIYYRQRVIKEGKNHYNVYYLSEE